MENKIDFTKIKTISIKDRVSKVNIINANKFQQMSDNINIPLLANELMKARKKKKKVLLMMGAKPTFLLLNNFIIGMMKKGYISHLAITGAAMIHDYELALYGKTGEDVETYLHKGYFGLCEETGYGINSIVKLASKNNVGLGFECGRFISNMMFKYREHSILYNTYKLNIPLTIHTGIGNDIVFEHHSCSGEDWGKALYNDFKKITNTISNIEDGVVINIGSEVIMPEVWLKGLAICKNQGYVKKNNFIAVNIDMNEHYRPTKNILERTRAKKIFIQDKFERVIPTLYYMLK